LRIESRMNMHRLLFAALMLSASTASAEGLPFFATVQLGPALEVAGDWGTQLKIGQEFGYHFSGGQTGFALGLSLEESFGNCTEASGVSCISLQAGPKMWWDFQPIADVPFFLAPSLRLAFVHVRVDADGLGTGTFTGAGLQVAFEARYIISERMILFARPITLDFIAGGSNRELGYVYDDNIAMRYDITFGGGIAF
jgi:hypothetical protein